MSFHGLPRSAKTRPAAFSVLLAPQRKNAAGLFTAALFLTTSSVSVTLAQGTATLPPLSVETNAKKKAKTPTTAKSAPKATPTPPAESAASPAGLPPDSYNVQAASSPKTTGPLLDTPQTVTVVPGTIIQERGNTNLTEVLKNTPGISFNAGENAFSSSTNNFSIRGFDASGSIFIDGVRDSGSYARDMFNVERVEIIKGPAADNGRGAAGGYVNIVTKSPTLQNFVAGDVSLGFDEYNSEIRRRATIDVNQRSGTTAVRLNGMVEDGGVAGRDIAEASAWGLAPSIAFGLGTPFRAVFSYEHFERHDLPEWGVPGAMIPGMKNFNAVAAKASRDNFYGLRSDYDDLRGDAFTTRLEYDLAPGITVSNLTRWSQTDREGRFAIPGAFTLNGTGDGGTVASNLQFYGRVNTSLTNQTNLSATVNAGGLKHVIATGVEVTREESEGKRKLQLNAGAADIFNPNPNRFVAPAFVPTQRTDVQIDTVAAYFYDTIHLSRQWQLVGGLRLEHYNVDIAGPGIPKGSFSDSETTLGGKVGLVYKPVSNGTLYASYGVSALPPGSYLSNPDISRPDGDGFPGFVAGSDPIQMHNYEVGVKWDFFAGRLSTAAALFRTEKQGVASTGCNVLTPPACPANEQRVAEGEQIVQGIELSFAGNLTERWKVFGGVAVIDSERRHSAEFDRIRKNANPGDYGAVVRTNGDELAFTPNITASLWMTYALTDRFTFGGGVRYVGESWLGRPDDAIRIIPNGAFGKLPDYFVVDVMASYALTDNIDLRFNVDNVFDELYAASSNWPGTRAQLGAPRTFRIGTAFKF